MKDARGAIHVYTGCGKGKTTAALGLALRALGHGQQVFIGQFMKSGRDSGEVRMARTLPGLTIEPFGRDTFVCRESPDPEDVRAAQAGLERMRAIVAEGRHDLVVLDEVNVAMDCHLIDRQEVIALLQARPSPMEIVLTGRGAPAEIVALADLVSEVREIRHPWRRQIPARPGVEY